MFYSGTNQLLCLKDGATNELLIKDCGENNFDGKPIWFRAHGDNQLNVNTAVLGGLSVRSLSSLRGGVSVRSKMYEPLLNMKGGY
jgi:hypothetical protein